jgi:hypothetical protein
LLSRHLAAHAAGHARALSIYAGYAFNVLHDVRLAVELTREGMKESPRDMQMRRNLLLVLASSGQHEAAPAFYAETLRELPQAAQDKAFRALLDAPMSATISPATTPRHHPCRPVTAWAIAATSKACAPSPFSLSSRRMRICRTLPAASSASTSSLCCRAI